MSDKNLDISVKDWLCSMKLHGKRIFLLSALISFSGFLFFAKNHVYFSATAVFQAAVFPLEAKKMDFISSTLGFLSGQQSNSAENPFIIKKSNKILSDIAIETNLQAEIIYNNATIFKRILDNIHLETAFHNWRKPEALNHLTTDKVYIPTTIFNNGSNKLFQCQHTEYRGEILKKLKITLSSKGDFSVFDTTTRSYLGQGFLNKTFFFSKGSFRITTSSFPKKQQSFSLLLIPLPQTIEILKKNLEVTKDFSSHNLFKISYKHINRHQAKNIVEKTLVIFKKFLEEEEKSKIAKEKSFFDEKEHAVYLAVDKELEKQKSLITNEINNTEVASILHYQTCVKMLGTVKQELREVEQDLHLNEQLSCRNFLKDSSFHNRLISPYLMEKDSLESQNTKYKNYLDFLRKNKETIPCNLFDNHELSPHINRITQLDYDLFKQRNWSVAEKERLQAELIQERRFLEAKLENLLDISQIKQLSLEHHIDFLRQQTIKDLVNKKTFLEKDINKTLASLKNSMIYKLNQELGSSKLALLFKQLEFLEKAKYSSRISHSMNYLSSPLLPDITVPNLPEHPQLILKTGFLFLLSCLFMIASLCVKEIFLSPSTRDYNLAFYKKPFFGHFPVLVKGLFSLDICTQSELQNTARLLNCIPASSTIIEISSYALSPFGKFLADILSRRTNKTVLIIYLNNDLSQQDILNNKTWTIQETEGVHVVTTNALSLHQNYPEELAERYHYIILCHEISAPSKQIVFSLDNFCNIHLFHIANERLNFINRLVPGTILISGLEIKPQFGLISIIGNFLLEYSFKWSFAKKSKYYPVLIKKNRFQEYF